MPRVLRRPQAEADLLGIWLYIAQDDPAQADRWIEELDRHFALWATQPMMGSERGELAVGLRSMPVGRHVAFYLPLEDGIDLVRVLHGSQDINDRFFP